MPSDSYAQNRWPHDGGRSRRDDPTVFSTPSLKIRYRMAQSIIRDRDHDRESSFSMTQSTTEQLHFSLTGNASLEASMA
jgi:hypothetical protein